MKVFLIDKYNKSSDLVKILHDNSIDNVEIVKDEKCKFTKNDVVIVADDANHSELSKSARTIFITNNKTSNNVWKLANDFRCIDIIDGSLDRKYIGDRIVSALMR